MIHDKQVLAVLLAVHQESGKDGDTHIEIGSQSALIPKA